MQALSIAITGMQAQQFQLEVDADNLSNLNTAGYKQKLVSFQSLLGQSLQDPGVSKQGGAVSLVGMQMGLGVKPVGIYKVHTQGPLQKTDNQLDMSILGRGYFQIKLPDGRTAYTRVGYFNTSKDGLLSTQQGYSISPAISIPQNASSVSISDDGVISVSMPSQNGVQTIGTISLARFINENGLKEEMGNIYTYTTASGSPILGQPMSNGMGGLKQGYIERSNVSPIKAVTNLITTQRTYEMNSKVISAAGQMMSQTSRMNG